MKYKIDLHVHSNASTHAYNTLQELVDKANKKGLEGFALTNHGPAMPDGAHQYHFGNLKVLPQFIDGIRVLKGIEANIINIDGSTDIPENYYGFFDIILAGFHNQSGYDENDDIKSNTQAVVNVIKKGEADILAHMGNPKYPLDYEEVAKTASEYNVAIELNNSSFGVSRAGSNENCIELLKFCKKYNTYISLGSDTHFSKDLCNFSNLVPLLEKYEIPEEQVLNSSFELLDSFLKSRRKQ